MKKALRNVRIQLYKRAGEVYKAKCSWPAGKSGYCNHVMALLHKIAEYSLNQLTEIQVFLDSGESLGTRRL